MINLISKDNYQCKYNKIQIKSRFNLSDWRGKAKKNSLVGVEFLGLC